MVARQYDCDIMDKSLSEKLKKNNVTVGHNCIISDKAIIGKNTRVGHNVIINDNVEIGEDSFIGNNTILGEQTIDYYDSSKKYESPILKIGKGALIRSNCTIYSGTKIGDFFTTGHYVTIREGVEMGHHCSMGIYSMISQNTKIGNYLRTQMYVLIADDSILGDYVWIFPNVVMTSDKHPPCSKCNKGITIEDYAIIGAGTVFLPGVKIEKNSIVSAGSVVTKDVKAGMLYAGNPAKPICKATKIACNEGLVEQVYPWQDRYSKGYPWDKNNK